MDLTKEPEPTSERVKLDPLPYPLPAEYLLLVLRLKSWRNDAADRR